MNSRARAVGLSMMCYRKRESEEGLFGRVPIEGAHGESVIFPVPDGNLLFEIVEGKEFM